MKKIVTVLFLIGFLVGCKDLEEATLAEGIWLAELEVMDGNILPFNFKLSNTEIDGYRIAVYNADEVILVDEVEIKDDSIKIKLPVYEGYIVGSFTKNSIEGEFIKAGLSRVVPFKATYGVRKRFKTSNPPSTNLAGIWETEFSAGTSDSYRAKGVFKQNKNLVTGTFRTTTGDYRYLEGVMEGDSLKLSTFDGAHAFLFLAKVTDSSLNGVFYSGNHFKEPFSAKRNDAYELPSADSLTFLKKGYDAFEFSFPDANGHSVSLKDERFKNKVVVVQIMGTWCPNCLDETKFYVDYLKNNGNSDLEVIALAFEYAKNEEAAFKNILRLKERIGIDYPIVLAQFGSTDKELAQQKLPMLNQVLSYPTSIFIDRTGKVRKIHTGFNGPATGAAFLSFKKEFDGFVKGLLAE